MFSLADLVLEDTANGHQLLGLNLHHSLWLTWQHPLSPSWLRSLGSWAKWAVALGADPAPVLEHMSLPPSFSMFPLHYYQIIVDMAAAATMSCHDLFKA